jgi:hypothetical protein
VLQKSHNWSQSGPTTKRKPTAAKLKRWRVSILRGPQLLAHASGDATNAVLAALGYNFRRLLAWLRFLLLKILIALGLAAQLKLA